MIDATDVGPETPHPTDTDDTGDVTVERLDAPAEPDAVPTVDTLAGPPVRRIPTPLLIALGTVVATARYVFARDRIIFHLAPDEAGSLAMARWLSGGVRWSMFDHSTWRPGLATLVAPIYAFTDHVPTLMRGTFLINAALAGVAAVILARLALRLTTLSPAACALTAGAIAVAPSSLSGSANVWAESLITVLFLTCLWWLLEFFDRPRLDAGIYAMLAMVAGFTSHSRLLPVLPVVILLVVVTFLVKRQWADAALSAAVGFAGTLLSFAYADWIFRNVWDSPADSNTVSTVIDRLDAPLEVLESGLGQLWYQLTATVGVFAFGAVVVLGRAVRRRVPGLPVARDARVIVAVTAPLVVVSIVFMSDRTRTDHLIYGRYNDAILWPVLVIGVGWLVAFARRASYARRAALVVATGAVMLASAWGVDALHGDAMADSIGVRPMIAGLLPFIGNEASIDAIRVTVLAIVTMLAIALVAPARRRPAVMAVVVVLAAAFAWSGLRTHDALALRLNTWAKAEAVVEIATIVPADETIGFRFVREADDPAATWNDQRRRAQLYQLYLPDRRFERDRGTDDGVGPYVFAPTGDPEMEAAGAEVLWTDPTVRVALWLEPTDPTTPGDQ